MDDFDFWGLICVNGNGRNANLTYLNFDNTITLNY